MPRIVDLVPLFKNPNDSGKHEEFLVLNARYLFEGPHTYNIVYQSRYFQKTLKSFLLIAYQSLIILQQFEMMKYFYKKLGQVLKDLFLHGYKKIYLQDRGVHQGKIEEFHLIEKSHNEFHLFLEVLQIPSQRHPIELGFLEEERDILVEKEKKEDRE
jgi:hypothetical protein